jgi:hypothetical protein
LNFRYSFEDLVAVDDNDCDLMSIEDLCSESPEVEDTSDFELVFLDGPL